MGRAISVTNPPGYCKGGDSPVERELHGKTQASLRDARIVYWGARCSELADLRAGRRDSLGHWLQIQMLGNKGEFKPVAGTREAMLAGMAGAKPKIDIHEANRRLAKGFENAAIEMGDASVQVIGRDGNAVYMMFRMNLKVGQVQRKINAVGAVTLVNSVPLSLLVYEEAGSSQRPAEMNTTLRALLMSVLTEN